MNSGQKIGLTSSLIKKKIQQSKTNQSQQPILIMPTVDDKQRLRKKIAQYKRIQRRDYPKKKVAQLQVQAPIQQEVEPVQNVQQIKPQEPQQPENQQNQKQQNQNQNVAEKGKLQSQVLVQYLDNQFYDQQCIEADKDLENIKNQNSKFKKKMKRVNSIMQRLHKSVHQLKDRYDQIEVAQLLGKKRNKRRQAQARAFVKSQVQQKKEMQKKYDSIKQQQTKKKKQQQEVKKKEQEKEKQQKAKEIKKELQTKKKQKQKQDKQKVERQQKAKRFLGKYLQEQPLYKILQQKFQKKENKEKQIQKAYLKKRGQKFKPIQQTQLTSHLKIHYQKIRDNQQIKQQQKMQKQQQIIQQNLKLLQKIYRGKNYQKIQQELEERQKLKLKLKEKRERVKKYQAYVKENFKPQVKQGQQGEQQQNQDGQNSSGQQNQEDDQQNQNAQKQDKQPQYRKVKRYKFLQGKSCGEIMQTVKMPLSQKLQRRVGDGYLQYLKSLPKRKKRTADDRHFSEQKLTEAPSSKSRLVQIPKLPRPKHFSVDISQNPNRHEINNLLILLKSKDGMVQMKQKYLCKLSDRSQYQNVQNQINTNIIANIERKLSLLNKL